MTSKISILLIGLTIFLHSCFSPNRSSKQLYEAFFGKPTNNCVKILESRDANAVDDQMLYLHFKTCPEEVKRILSLVSYTSQTMSKKDIELMYLYPSNTDESLIPYTPKWFDIRKLGDSCIRFYYKWEDKDYAQVLYLSNDSSEVFYREDSW